MKHYCHGNNPTWLIANQRLLLSLVCQFSYVSDYMRFSARSTCWVLLCSYNFLSIVYASVEFSCCLLYFFFFLFYLYSTFIAFCCTPKALYNHVCVCGGGGRSLLNHHQCASTWMMWRLPRDNGASETLHLPQLHLYRSATGWFNIFYIERGVISCYMCSSSVSYMLTAAYVWLYWQ